MKYNVFENKNCFITGATGGIGREIAIKMAENRCNLFLTSTDESKLKNLQEEIETLQNKNNIFYQEADLTQFQAANQLIAAARDKLGAIDIIINCAGVFIVKPLSGLNLEDFETTLNLNVRAPFIFCKEFSRDMQKKRWGRIVNIGSSSAYMGSKETTLYCAAKHAILGLSRALHSELKEHNIRTFCVSPAGVKTEMGKKIRNQNYNTFLDPKEIAKYIAFICSFDSELISDEIRLNRMVIE